MVQAEIADGELALRVEGADKIWAFKSELRIPLQHIASARVDTEIVHRWWHGIKMPGTAIPGLITAGSFYQHGQRVFWDIHHPREAVVIALHDETYNELVIQVENPEALVAELQAAIAPRRP